MVQLHLPAAHTEDDLVLAGQIAMTLGSAELYVAWTPEHGQAAPVQLAELHEIQLMRWTGMLALLFRTFIALWGSFLRGGPKPAPSGRPSVAPGASLPRHRPPAGAA